MSDINKIAGMVLKEYRLAHNLSQEEIANAVGMGKSAYCYYEFGRMDIPLGLLYRLAGYYKIDVEQMITSITRKLLENNSTGGN